MISFFSKQADQFEWRMTNTKRRLVRWRHSEYCNIWGKMDFLQLQKRALVSYSERQPMRKNGEITFCSCSFLEAIQIIAKHGKSNEQVCLNANIYGLSLWQIVLLFVRVTIPCSLPRLTEAVPYLIHGLNDKYCPFWWEQIYKTLYILYCHKRNAENGIKDKKRLKRHTSKGIRKNKSSFS